MIDPRGVFDADPSRQLALIVADRVFKAINLPEASVGFQEKFAFVALERALLQRAIAFRREILRGRVAEFFGLFRCFRPSVLSAMITVLRVSKPSPNFLPDIPASVGDEILVESGLWVLQKLRNELFELRLAGRPGFRMKRNSEARERKQQQYAAAGKAPLAHTKDYSTERARIEGGPSLREI